MSYLNPMCCCYGRRFSQPESSDENGEGAASAVEPRDPDQSTQGQTPPPQDTPDLLNLFDAVIFAGDLNYRIRGNREIVDKLLLNGMHEVLIANDQLLWSKARGSAFQGFEEGPLHFRPTYKFDRESEIYDTSSKRRIPAWTDRILYKGGRCKLLTYQSEPYLRSSDHR